MNKCYKDFFKMLYAGKFKNYQNYKQTKFYNSKFKNNDYQKGYKKAFYDVSAKSYLTNNKLKLKIIKYFEHNKDKKSEEFNHGYNKFMHDYENKII